MEKTKNKAAQELVSHRWKKTTPTERKQYSVKLLEAKRLKSVKKQLKVAKPLKRVKQK